MQGLTRDDEEKLLRNEVSMVKQLSGYRWSYFHKHYKVTSGIEVKDTLNNVTGYVLFTNKGKKYFDKHEITALMCHGRI